MPEQDAPKVNNQPYVQDLVVGYIYERKRHGVNTYGTALQAHNGRDALRDAFEEAVDLTMYLAQALIERDGELPSGL